MENKHTPQRLGRETFFLFGLIEALIIFAPTLTT